MGRSVNNITENKINILKNLHKKFLALVNKLGFLNPLILSNRKRLLIL